MKFLTILLVICFLSQFQFDLESDTLVSSKKTYALENYQWIALAILGIGAVGIYAYKKSKDDDKKDTPNDPSTPGDSTGNWVESINLSPNQSASIKGLDYNKDFVVEVEMKGIQAGYRNRLLNSSNGYLDIWPESSDNLAWRLFNKRIWFVEPTVGSIDHFQYPSEKDHWALTPDRTYSRGDHKIKIEYKISINEAKFYWDNKLAGHYKLVKKSNFSPMKDVKIQNMTSAVFRYKYE